MKNQEYNNINELREELMEVKYKIKQIEDKIEYMIQCIYPQKDIRERLFKK